jgi:hypothetical protein
MTLKVPLYDAAFLSLGILDRWRLSRMATNKQAAFVTEFVNLNCTCSDPESFS